MWPFKEEKRAAQGSYTDSLVAALQAAAGAGGTADVCGVACVEAAAGVLGRAFASAEVKTRGRDAAGIRAPGPRTDRARPDPLR